MWCNDFDKYTGLLQLDMLIMLLRVQAHGRALLVLPYISVVTEKTAHLAAVLRPMGIRVKGYFGSAESGTPLATK